jgi:hypothetical protein
MVDILGGILVALSPFIIVVMTVGVIALIDRLSK